MSAVPTTVVLPPESSPDRPSDEQECPPSYSGGSESYDRLDFTPRPDNQLRPHYHSTNTLK